MSRPEEVVELLAEATRAFAGCDVKIGDTRGGGDEVLVPSVSVWRPASWLKYGLPYFVGRVVGRCILLFYGIRRFWTKSEDAKPKTMSSRKPPLASLADVQEQRLRGNHGTLILD